ncbi:glycoside hydrolase family 2 TIM barrel-domain containing protein [Bacteroidota bacterium]
MKYFSSPTKTVILILFITIITFSSGCKEKPIPETIVSNTQSFNLDWKFVKDSLTGAEDPGFDDSQWRSLDLPHDWSIEDLPGSDTGDQIGPFSKDSPGTTSTGYVIGGTGWYRKHFKLDPLEEGKIVKIYFDGVYNQSDVWVNGQHAGFHAYGYTPFFYDITEFLNPAGQENVIAVKVINSGQNSRWYTGSGIYRNVKLLVQDPVHIDPWSVSITTPDIADALAKVHIQLAIRNLTKENVETTIIAKLDKSQNEETGFNEAQQIMKAGIANDIVLDINVENPDFWSVENPNLYKLIIEVSVAGSVVDSYTTNFGIRSIEFSADKGFLLNGKNMFLKGACIHHDNGILGSAAFDRAETRRVEILKANGFNAIRTAHNPPSDAFLDACDRIGMLVIDESFDMWTRAKKPQDYSLYFNEWWEKDMRAMLLRDRNHPSVIIWSIGNEIPERGDSTGYRIARQLANVVKEIDSTRPVTNAICRFWDNPELEWDATIPAFDVLDIGGYNYRWQRYESDHVGFPKRIMMGTESVALEAYENWQLVEKHPYVIGDFVWTGMDYFGETGIGNTVYLKKGEESSHVKLFPWFNAWCGDIDVIGVKKPQSYYRDIVWGNTRINMFVHAPVPEGTTEGVSFWGWPDEEMRWNWPGQEGKTMQVSVYSSFDTVRLELNGNVVGDRPVNNSDLTANFDVTYEPGELKASGLVNGQVVDSKSINTAGPPVKIIMKIEDTNIQADRNDLAFFNIVITDKAGIVVTDASIPVTVTVRGQGELLASGSASPNHMESLTDEVFTTFRGRGLVIVRPKLASGNFQISAESNGLESASMIIHTH